MTRLRALILAVAVSAAPPAAAQPALQPGDMVRIRAGSAAGHYTVVSVDSAALTLRVGAANPLEVPLVAIQRLDLHRGRRPPAQGLLRGGAIGFAGGFAGGAVLGIASGDDPPGSGFFAMTAREKARVYGALLGSSGAIVGGTIGYLAPGDRWSRVRVVDTVRIGRREHGGLLIGVASVR
jgi:hypothetical protein